MKILQFLPYMLFQYGFFALLLGFPVFLASRWCLARKNRNFRTAFRGLAWAVVAACALMCVYGVLRLTGVILLPGDNTYSTNWYDASWRDEGVGVFTIYGSFLTGLIPALLQARRAAAEE